MFKKSCLKTYFIIFFLQFIFNTSYSETIKNFKINGNERVSDQTVIMFSGLEVGNVITQNNLNDALKDLFLTNYFSNISIENNKGIIFIDVEENPIIQSITINGIKKDSIIENLKKITSKSEKYPFIESKINDQVILLKNILKTYGYYFLELETVINQNENNSVDLIYNFKLGEIAKIKKINFIGKKIFRDSTLRNIIVSEESKFWKFLTKNKFLDSNRINLDISKLTEFYKNNGYINVDIKSTTAIINQNDQFELLFNINAGNKYFVENIIFEKENDDLLDTINLFEKKANELKGIKYSKRSINKFLEYINDFTLENDFVFINAKAKEIIKNDNKIDILINFDELDKVYVNRINILGNYITEEKVLRNKFIVDEGDPYNEILFNKSIQNLKALNIFKSVEYKTSELDEFNKIIDITVEEKPTGELFAGAGTGTSGSSLTAGIKENNYLGLGIKLDTNLTLTDDAIKGNFTVLNPNYKNSDKSVRTNIESSTNDFMSASGYKTSRVGFSIGTEFEQKTDLFVDIELSNFYEDLETSSAATNIVKKQEGNYFENLISYKLTYNKLDQNFQPSDGFLNKFSQTFPIYSDDVAIENFLTTDLYHSFDNDVIFSAKFFLKTINSLDDNVRISKRVFVPGSRLRGFEIGKIGPKDGDQFIGGNYASSLNLSSTFPNLLLENDDFDFNLFFDFANAWNVDYDSSLDSNKIRSSTGIAVNWFSPIGPLTFSYAIPLSEAETDITEKFRFQIGTSF